MGFLIFLILKIGFSPRQTLVTAFSGLSSLSDSGQSFSQHMLTNSVLGSHIVGATGDKSKARVEIVDEDEEGETIIHLPPASKKWCSCSGGGSGLPADARWDKNWNNLFLLSRKLVVELSGCFEKWTPCFFAMIAGSLTWRHRRFPGFLIMICAFCNQCSYAMEFGTFAIYFRQVHNWNDATWRQVEIIYIYKYMYIYIYISNYIIIHIYLESRMYKIFWSFWGKPVEHCISCSKGSFIRNGQKKWSFQINVIECP